MTPTNDPITLSAAAPDGTVLTDPAAPPPEPPGLSPEAAYGYRVTVWSTQRLDHRLSMLPTEAAQVARHNELKGMLSAGGLSPEASAERQEERADQRAFRDRVTSGLANGVSSLWGTFKGPLAQAFTLISSAAAALASAAF